MTVSSRPRGRDEVRRAVISATRELLSERGPEGWSVREVAARAGVNHALVHRHFGTKANVLEQTLEDEAAAMVAAVAESGLTARDDTSPEYVAQLLDVLAARPSYWRTLVHAVLESPEVAVPGTAATTELFTRLWRERSGDAGEAGPAATAVAGSTVLGWLIFGRFMSEAVGADLPDTRGVVADQVARLVTGDATGGAAPAPPRA